MTSLIWRRSITVTVAGNTQWDLMWGKRAVATVWSNGVWHTWDAFGAGGENSSTATASRAARDALIALVRQDAEPIKGWAKHSPRCITAIRRACALRVALGTDYLGSTDEPQ